MTQIQIQIDDLKCRMVDHLSFQRISILSHLIWDWSSWVPSIAPKHETQEEVIQNTVFDGTWRCYISSSCTLWPLDGLMDTGRSLQIDQVSHWKNMSGHYADIKIHQYNIRGSIFLYHERSPEIQLVSISAMEQTQCCVVWKKKEVNFVALSLLVE